PPVGGGHRPATVVDRVGSAGVGDARATEGADLRGVVVFADAVQRRQRQVVAEVPCPLADVVVATPLVGVGQLLVAPGGLVGCRRLPVAGFLLAPVAERRQLQVVVLVDVPVQLQVILRRVGPPVLLAIGRAS